MKTFSSLFVLVADAAVVLGLAGALACSSSSSSAGPSSTFPFSGPSCPNAQPSCWQCVQDQCPAAATCIASTCSGFWSCLCACADLDDACHVQCVTQDNASCAQCGDTIVACGQAHCFSQCRTSDVPVIGETCTSESVPSCPGGTAGFCYVGALSGIHPTVCTSAKYRINDIDFPCASCKPDDLAACKAQVTAYCEGDAGDGGALVDASSE